MARSSSARASIEDQLATLRELRDSAGLPPSDLATRLLPFLKHANNLLVARAADLARERDARELVPELSIAFKRFLEAAEKSDPQCWAKNALSKSLHHLGFNAAELYLQGLHLHQYEPVWGGQSDVAGTLRSNCAHALIDCHELTHTSLMRHLVSLVADPDKSVRAEVLRAIAQAGGDSAILLLRLRALTAATTEEPEVIGQCYSGLLALEGTAAVPFVADFLKTQDERSSEAAIALGETRTPEALAALLICLRSPSAASNTRSRIRRLESDLEPAFASVLTQAIALTRRPEAITALLDLVSTESTYAEAAIEALANASLGEDVQNQLAAILTRIDSTRLTRIYHRHFPSQSATTPGAPL